MKYRLTLPLLPLRPFAGSGASIARNSPPRQRRLGWRIRTWLDEDTCGLRTWKPGSLENWKTGKPENRKTGKPENWKTGKLENWKTGKLENWKTEYVTKLSRNTFSCL
jgi:hypothetical protein